MSKPKFSKLLPFIFLIVGTLGLAASFALTYDKIHVLKDPLYSPGCNINPILSCGSVMQTEQADLLGLPNTIFGIAGFSGLIALGLALLAGATFKKWLWLVINAGAFVGFVFFVYLFFQSVFRIDAICPYCFVVWMIMPPLFWYITLFNLNTGNINLRRPRIKDFILRHHGDALVVWYVIVLGILLKQFWYYWKTLI